MAEHHFVQEVKGGLTRKLGPMPVWAWAGIAGLGLGFLLYRSRARGDQATTSTGAPVATDSGSVPGYGGSAGTPAGLPGNTAGDLTSGTGDATYPGYPTIGQEIEDVVGLVDALRGGGLLDIGRDTPTPPGGLATDGGSTVTATAHPAAARSKVKVNQQKGSPREGKAFKTVKLPNGMTAHVYANGDRVIMPGTTSVAGTSQRAPAVHAPAPPSQPHAPAAPVVNRSGNENAGQTYRVLTSGGWIVHRYGSGSSYRDVRIRRA